MSNHTDYWSCIENETTKQLAHRRVNDDPADGLDLVTVYECRDCGNKYAVETYCAGTDWEEHDFYGLKDSATVESVLADYGL